MRADSPYKTFGDLVDGIKKNPGRLKYSTAGVGTIHEMGPQMLFEILKLGKDGGIQIPYKGGGDATVALLSGEVDINCTNLGTALAFIKSGQLRALMTTTPERYKEIPNVPTAKEVGYPQLERIIGWSALYGPPGMEPKLVAYWSDVLKKVAKDPQWTGATEKIGSVPRILPPDETARFVKEQFETSTVSASRSASCSNKGGFFAAPAVAAQGRDFLHVSVRFTCLRRHMMEVPMGRGGASRPRLPLIEARRAHSKPSRPFHARLPAGIIFASGFVNVQRSAHEFPHLD